MAVGCLLSVRNRRHDRLTKRCKCIKMKKLFIISILFVIGYGCSIFKRYTYEICLRNLGETSLLTNNRLIGIADTTIVSISGQILDKRSSELAPYAIIQLKNIVATKPIIQNVEPTGEFSFDVYPGKYRLKVSHLGYNEIDTIVVFKSGEIRNMTLSLGKADGFTMHQIKSKKELTNDELEELTKKLTQ